MEASPKQQSPGDVRIGFGDRMLMAQPDSVLCKLAARGNANAYEVLFERYRQPVFAFVFHLLGRRDGTQDCEDIVQDTFAKAFAGIREKSVDGSFRAWIYTIARNRTYDLIRSRRSNVHSLDAAAAHDQPPAAEHTQTDKHAEQRLELTWLVAAVADLPERQREALLMRELGGMSHSQIADQLGTTVSATKKLIGRGREAVTEAATIDGYRPRRLSRDLALAAPVVPLAAVGLGLGAAGGAAFASGGAAAGGAAFGGKTAAAVLTVMALGGGAAVVEHERATDSASPSASAAAAGPAAANAAAGDDSGSRSNNSGRGELPMFGEIDDDELRRERRSSRDESDARDDRRRSEDDFDGTADDEPRPPRRERSDDRERSFNSGPGGGDEPREPRPPDDSGNSGPGGGGGGDLPEEPDRDNSGPGGDGLPE